MRIAMYNLVHKTACVCMNMIVAQLFTWLWLVLVLWREAWRLFSNSTTGSNFLTHYSVKPTQDVTKQLQPNVNKTTQPF